MNGLVFASYRFLMKLQLESADATPTLAQIALAGAGSGIISSCVRFALPFFALPLPLSLFVNISSAQREDDDPNQADNDPYGTHQDPTTVPSHPYHGSASRMADLQRERGERSI